jgi:hypothetical protein
MWIDTSTPPEEHRLWLLENRVLKRIFEPKREEVAEGWKRLHNKELHNLCTQPNIRVIKSMGMGMACSTLGRDENFIQCFCKKSEGKRPLRRPRRRWEDNIIMDLREIGLEGMSWIHLAQDRDQLRALVNTVMNLYVP